MDRSRKKRSVTRELGSKYFGRSVKKWRLIANLSQEDLAQRAGISAAMVGTVELERARFSTEILGKLSLGLESALGRPMLESLFADSVAVLWKESAADEARLREERGLKPAPYQAAPSEEAMAKAADEAYRAVRKWSLLWFRALGKGRSPGWLLGDPNDFDPHTPPRGADRGIARVRKAKATPKERARS